MTIEENKSLKNYNTFGIDVSARYYAEINTVDDFRELLGDKNLAGKKRLILGGGSNILFTKNFDGLVIRNCLKGIEFSSSSGRTITVKAAAGEIWHEMLLQCIEKNYAGIENLSLIPGCVGAAPMQNIGAYGVEIKDVFHQLEALDMTTGEPVKFSLNDCHFGYRESIFKNEYRDRFLITSVSLLLSNLNIPNAIYRFRTDYGDVKATLSDMRVYDLSIKAVSDAIIKIRASKLPNPRELGNAGSFFKNPVISKSKYEELIFNNPLMPHYPQSDGRFKIPAGWLLSNAVGKANK